MNNFYIVYMYRKHENSFDECMGAMCIMQGYEEAKAITAKLNRENLSENLYYRYECTTVFTSAAEASDFLC